MPALLILAVGTGTSDQHSNLAQGLVNPLYQLRPRLFWLVPSASPDSTTLAEIVRDGAPAGSAFQPWTTSRAISRARPQTPLRRNQRSRCPRRPAENTS